MEQRTRRGKEPAVPPTAYEPALGDAPRTTEPMAPPSEAAPTSAPETIELREEELVAHTEQVPVGEVVIRTEVEEVPSRLEAEVARDEVVVEHIPVGEVVRERVEPWDEDGARVMPVYEEQFVLVKQLILKEKVRIRRVPVTETRTFDGTVRREQLVVEKPDDVAARERPVNATGSPPDRRAEPKDAATDRDLPGEPGHEGLFEKVVRKVFF